MSTGQAGTVSSRSPRRTSSGSAKTPANGPEDPSGRFEAVDTPPSIRHGSGPTGSGGVDRVIFARAFLAARGFDYEVLFDTA